MRTFRIHSQHHSFGSGETELPDTAMIGTIHELKPDMDSAEGQVMLIDADTLMEARSIMREAMNRGWFPPFLNCGCSHDCCGHAFTTDFSLRRINEWGGWIAIHKWRHNF